MYDVESFEDVNSRNRFPKQPKAVIRDTLDTFAERIGAKEADKKWVIRRAPNL